MLLLSALKRLNMKKIAFLSFDNPADRRSWSGTLNSEYLQLQKFYEVEWLCPKFNLVFLTFVKVFNKLRYLFTKKTYMPMYSSMLMNKLAMKKVNNNIKKGSFDVVFGVCTSAVQPFLKFNGPNIYMSDAIFSLMNGFYFKNMNNTCIRNGNSLEEKTMQNASAVIFSSNWAKEGAIKDYKIDENKIVVVPFGANIDVPEIKDKEIDLENDAIHILFIGVDWNRKGGNIAVKTVYLLNKIQNKYKFVLDAIGGKPDYPVDEKVILLHGFINKNDKKELDYFYEIIDKAYLNILPTKAECSGIALIEASAYGIPSITYNVGGTLTNVRDGVTGYCLDLSCDENDFAKKILNLVNNKTLYKKIAESGKKLVNDELNWNVWGQKVHDIIKNLIGE